MSLVGKFFFHCGKDYSQAGEIIEQVDDMLLVRFEKCEHIPASMVVLPVSSIVGHLTAEGGFEGDWELFNSRAELDAWLEWLEAPDEMAPKRAEGATLN